MSTTSLDNPAIFRYKGNDYAFAHTKTIDGNYKKILFGSFIGNAPPGLECNKRYCLKAFDAISDPTSMNYSQQREAYDLLDFQGDHLRKILCRSDAAATVVENLQSQQHWTAPVSGCMTVEPCYESLSDYFSHCARYPVLTRLDIVLQFALGSKELSDNSICGWHFIAHRDLKWINGVIDPAEESLRIRLLDFATAHMDQSSAGACRPFPRRTGTSGAGISPENTSPESIFGTSVNERTDVYALGMLLASLFITVEKHYRNPNKLWLIRAGWNDESYLNSIGDAIAFCKEAYDGVTEDSVTWIEKSLKKDYKVTTRWEKLPAPILSKIRNLFYRATRIESHMRCGRDAFISTLKDIIAEVKAMDTENAAAEPVIPTKPRGMVTPAPVKLPVSVFLFNRANSTPYKAAYESAAGKALQELTAESEMNGLPAHHVLCVSYGSLEGSSFEQETRPLSDGPVEADRLAECIRCLTSAGNAPTDYMLYGLYKAYQLLHAQRDRFYFDGQLFLFTPQVPDDKLIEPFPSRETGYDRQTLFAKLEESLDCDSISVQAYTVIEPGENSWCTGYTLLHGDPEPTPDPTPDTPAAEAHDFQVDKNAPYIKLPNGQRSYCGIVKK